MKNTTTTSKFITLLTLVQLIYLTSCTDDVANPCHTTYEHDVQQVMMKTCAYAGCHSGATASPYVPADAKDYTTYEGMMQTVENGKFRERALDLMNMPPVNFVPQDKPTSLASDEVDMLKCWLDNGYPQR